MEKPIIPARVPLPAPIGSGPKVQISKHALIKKDMRDGRETVEGARNRVPHVHGARAMPAPTEGSGAGVPGMIKVRMDGMKSQVIERPPPAGATQTHAQQAIGRGLPGARPGLPSAIMPGTTGVAAAPARTPAVFTVNDAILCRELVAAHLDQITAAMGALEDGSPELAQASVVMDAAVHAAEALDVILAVASGKGTRPNGQNAASVNGHANGNGRAASGPAGVPRQLANGGAPVAAVSGGATFRPKVASPRPQLSGVKPQRSSAPPAAELDVLPDDPDEEPVDPDAPPPDATPTDADLVSGDISDDERGYSQ